MYRSTGHGWAAEPGHPGDCTDPNQPFDMSKPVTMKEGLCPPVPFAGSDITGNPVQFVDLDGDGNVDMIYSYRDKSDNLVTKIYFNEGDGHGGRKWVDGRQSRKNLKLTFQAKICYDSVSLGGLRNWGFSGTICQNQLSPSCNIKVVPSRTNGMQNRSYSFPSPRSLQCSTWPVNKKAYVLSSDGWQEAPGYTPPLDFVTQYGAPDKPAIDLFVQILSVDGSGLPSLNTNFVDPVTQQPVKGVLLNKGEWMGWRSWGSWGKPHRCARTPRLGLLRYASNPPIVCSVHGCQRGWYP